MSSPSLGLVDPGQESAGQHESWSNVEASPLPVSEPVLLWAPACRNWALLIGRRPSLDGVNLGVWCQLCQARAGPEFQEGAPHGTNTSNDRVYPCLQLGPGG